MNRPYEKARGSPEAVFDDDQVLRSGRCTIKVFFGRLVARAEVRAKINYCPAATPYIINVCEDRSFRLELTRRPRHELHFRSSRYRNEPTLIINYSSQFQIPGQKYSTQNNRHDWNNIEKRQADQSLSPSRLPSCALPFSLLCQSVVVNTNFKKHKFLARQKNCLHGMSLTDKDSVYRGQAWLTWPWCSPYKEHRSPCS